MDGWTDGQRAWFQQLWLENVYGFVVYLFILFIMSDRHSYI